MLPRRPVRVGPRQAPHPRKQMTPPCAPLLEPAPMVAGNCDLLPCVVPAYAGACVSPWTRPMQCQYVLVATAALATLCDVLVVCSASPACARPSFSLCQQRRAPANARSTHQSAHARAHVLTRLLPARLVRVCGRASTPRSPSYKSRNKGTTCRGKNGRTSWSHVTYESIAWRFA
jgi:hypothetical protein